jgi:hypothetical protein
VGSTGVASVLGVVVTGAVFVAVAGGGCGVSTTGVGVGAGADTLAVRGAHAMLAASSARVANRMVCILVLFIWVPRVKPGPGRVTRPSGRLSAATMRESDCCLCV